MEQPLSKQCPDCGEIRPLSAFPPAKKRSDGRATYCRPCMNVRSKDSYRKRMADQGRTVRDRVGHPDLRRCPDCGEVKPLEEFPLSGKRGRGYYCKPCHNVRGKRTVEAKFGSARHYHLMHRYGITAEEADAMAVAQGGVCTICRSRPPAHVDHDHRTGAVRGLLCFSCNGGLGQFGDRVDIMRNAIDYLERTTWPRTSEG